MAGDTPPPHPVLTTARLVLRPLRVDDAEALFPLYSDAEALVWWSHPAHETLEQTRTQLAKNVGQADWRAWAITLAGDDTAIGTVACGEKRQGRVMEIGYSLHRPHWGKGIAREAVTGLIDQLVLVEGNRRIFADTDPDNAPSNALLTSLGFTLEGRLRGEWETHIGVRDSFIWGLLADEWRARRA